MGDASSILVVEDRAIVAAKVKRDLEQAGYVVAGIAASVPAAAAMARTLPLDGAVLDIDLRGLPVYPVAAILRARAVPFLFLTGYGRVALPAIWRDVPLVEKPFAADALAGALQLVLSGAVSDPFAPRVTTPAIRRAWDRMRHSRDLLTEQRAWNEQAALAQD